MSIADKLTTIAENVPKVHDAGYQEGRVFGYNLGVEDGIEEGKPLGKREWMDKYQRAGGQYPTRYCMSMFAGLGWTNETFKPVLDIRVANAQYMFNNSGITANISKLCEERGVLLDFSPCTGFTSTFQNSKITGIDTIDTRNASDISSIFGGARAMVEINDLILKDDGSQKFGNSSFSSCSSLVNLQITGVIGMTVSISASPLNRASIESVVNALSDTKTGQTLTLNLDAVNKAFETSEGLNDGGASVEWSNLADTRPNWTIELSR